MLIYNEPFIAFLYNKIPTNISWFLKITDSLVVTSPTSLKTSSETTHSSFVRKEPKNIPIALFNPANTLWTILWPKSPSENPKKLTQSRYLNPLRKATTASLNTLLTSSDLCAPNKPQSLATIVKKQSTLTKTREEKSSTGSLMYTTNSDSSLKLCTLLFTSWISIWLKRMSKKTN